MKKFGFMPRAFILFVFLLSVFSLAQAQAARSWVAPSPTGDDANPCSRTAPCQTFAGAISKTHEGGEIDALEPGAYGTVSINKALTIDGGTGSGWASIHASSNTGSIPVNVTSGPHVDTAEVTLRNLSLNGIKQAGTGGDHGIQIIRAFNVHIQNVEIQNFSNEGINVAAADSVALFVDNARFTRDTTAIRMTTSSGFITFQFNRLNVMGSTNGVNAVANSRGTIRDSYFGGLTGTTNGGVKVSSGCTINIENSMFSNDELAVNVDTGGTARISDNCFYNNSVALSGTGTIATATNTNKFAGNSQDGSPNDVVGFK